MAKTNSFLFRKKYEKWLKSREVSESSLNSYCLQTKYPGTNLTFFDVIGAFAFNKEDLYALAAYEEWKKLIDGSKVSQKTIQNQNDYIAKYRLYFEEELLRKNAISLTGEDKKRLEEISHHINSIKYELECSIATDDNKDANIQLDGMDIIISHIGEEQFIKLAIESSYFFSRDLCEKRFEEIINIWINGGYDPMFIDYDLKYIPARYSSKNKNRDDGNQVHKKNPDQSIFTLQSCNKNCVIYQDGYRGRKKKYYGGGNGNTRVCQLIKKLTGYDLGAPLDRKSFKNFIISHIWGHATDPRYFTNLWNIAIVPAWANHLLDKDETGNLSAKLKATFKRVMIEYYSLDSYNWCDIDMAFPCLENNESAFNSHLTINVINKKEEGEIFGSISKESI